MTIKEMNDAFVPCVELALERNDKYGDTVSILRDEALVDLVLMKVMRLRRIKKTDAKFLDEIHDSINYLLFLKMRLKK